MIIIEQGKFYLNYGQPNQKLLGESRCIITMNIKNNLSKYRVWKGITQEQLSKELKISVTQIRLIEINHKYPKYQIRAKICKFFNVNQDQMFYNA